MHISHSKGWLLLFVQKTYSFLLPFSWDNHIMTIKGGRAQAKKEYPKVTFSIEVRPYTPNQIEAGKRLFSKLLQRAMENEKKEEQNAKAQGGGGQWSGGSPPLPPQNGSQGQRSWEWSDIPLTAWKDTIKPGGLNTFNPPYQKKNKRTLRKNDIPPH